MSVAVVDREGFVDVKPLLLEDEVGEEVSEFGGEVPIPAPTMTSLIQWRLLSCRVTPVAVATAYPPMLYQGLRCPYSLWSMVAVMKAVAVCPEGRSCGRSRRAVSRGRCT